MTALSQSLVLCCILMTWRRLLVSLSWVSLTHRHTTSSPPSTPFSHSAAVTLEAERSSEAGRCCPSVIWLYAQFTRALVVGFASESLGGMRSSVTGPKTLNRLWSFWCWCVTNTLRTIPDIWRVSVPWIFHWSSCDCCYQREVSQTQHYRGFSWE